MESIYVLEPGAYLRREGNSLKVVKEGAVVDRIPAAGLKRLLLVGYVTLTGAVLDFLIRNRVETVFVTPTGRFRARLGLDEHRHVALRRDQYLRLTDQTAALDAARRVVRGKLDNLGRFLRLRAGTDRDEALRTAALKLRAMSAHAVESNNPGVLRGVEGAGARVYFSGFPRLIKNESCSRSSTPCSPTRCCRPFRWRGSTRTWGPCTRSATAAPRWPVIWWKNTAPFWATGWCWG